MITVYGADWCEDTRRSQRLLRRLHVPHHYLNIDEDLDALDKAKALNHGERRTPTIDLGLGGEALVEREMLTRDQAHERLGIQNIGDVERVARTTAGLALIAAAGTSPVALRWPFRLIGLFATFTGVSGWCPAYHTAGMTSLGGPGDRPNESERAAWIVPRTDVSGDPPVAEAVEP